MRLKTWIRGARPYSFPASIAPVLIGLAVAYNLQQTISILTGTLTLLAALLMQIGANLSNDYYDWKNQIDKNDRKGFSRITGSGEVEPESVRLAFIASFAIAFLIGLYLIQSAGAPIAIIGVSSILLAYLYTGGPFPLAYYALGEIIVIFYYGPIAVWGTYFIQTGRLDYFPALVGIGPGLISAAIMAINNLRDRETDKLAGKHTLANILSKKRAALMPVIFVLIAAAAPSLMYLYVRSIALALVLPAFIVFMPVWKKIIAGIDLNISLKRTGQFLIIYSILLAIGFI